MDEIVDKSSPRQAINVNALYPMQIIGLGGQAGVWLAEDRSSSRICVAKQYQKSHVMNRIKAERMLAEKACMDSCGKHPFLTRLLTTFQTSESFFFVVELAIGGDLMTLAEERYRTGMPEATARHYCACLVLALRWMHTHGWLYRDLKLENVLIDEHGDAKLCDFGFAKRLEPGGRAYSLCGTVEYAPPELLWGQGRGPAGDWWALGVLLHEMLTGYNCFGDGEGSEEKSMKEIKAYAAGGEQAADQLEHSVLEAGSFKGGGRASEEEEPLSREGASFMRGLLNVVEEQRLGEDERFHELMNHPWVAGVDWEGMLHHAAKAPWLPPTDTYIHLPCLSLRSEDASILRNNGLTHDEELWKSDFSDFGPMRSEPWPMIDDSEQAIDCGPDAFPNHTIDVSPVTPRLCTRQHSKAKESEADLSAASSASYINIYREKSV